MGTLGGLVGRRLGPPAAGACGPRPHFANAISRLRTHVDEPIGVWGQWPQPPAALQPQLKLKLMLIRSALAWFATTSWRSQLSHRKIVPTAGWA